MAVNLYSEFKRNLYLWMKMGFIQEKKEKVQQVNNKQMRIISDSISKTIDTLIE